MLRKCWVSLRQPNLQFYIITNHRLIMKTIIIDPVTRIEGHAKISIYLDDEGQVNDARFHVTEFRGFEKFCVCLLIFACR